MSLSICAFRFVSQEIPEKRLNETNQAILEAVWRREKVFLSNTMVHNEFALRACIVNFRTQESDLEALIEEVVKAGRSLITSHDPG